MTTISRSENSGRSLVQSVRGLIVAGRLIFLLGGATVYALGASIAWYEGSLIDWRRAILGLGVVLSLQLMTHYANEYWDQEADALVSLRTPFSGGSGAVASGIIAARTLFQAGVVCAALAALLTIVLFWAGLPPLSLIVLITIALGALGYSQPPLRLVARGLGEMAAALIICFLTPLVAYSVQTGGVSALFVAACMPTILMQVAMIMAVELPDYNADLLTGKSNLVVRLGLRRAALFHNALLLAAYLALAASATWGRPQPAVLSPLLSLPVAAVQAWLITRAARGDNGKIHAMTFTAIVLFAGFCLLQIAGIIVAGLERG